MTGGGDLDEILDEGLNGETGVSVDNNGVSDDNDDNDDDDDDDDDDDEDDEDDDPDGQVVSDATADGLADAPVHAGTLKLDENDPDPTAGASDVGGLPGGIDDSAGGDTSTGTGEEQRSGGR